MILLLSILSPLVELLPNLLMSWWLPDNGKFEEYLKAWPRRAMIVFVVWVPILYTLGSLATIFIQISIGILIFLAFGLRLYFFDRAVQRKIENNLEHLEVTNIPEAIYFVAFSTIGYILFYAVPDHNYIVPLGLLLIFLGAFLMGKFRSGVKKNLLWDMSGRVVFTIGFLINLYNLASATLII